MGGIRLFGHCLAGAVTAALLAGCAGMRHGEGAGGLDLVILHVNDTHAHAAGVDARGNAAMSEEGSRGGYGRIAAAVAAAKREADNVLAFDAGDQFQGTLFYVVRKWPMLTGFVRRLPYDAVTLGNHEWDDGCGALAGFVGSLPFPVVAANLVPEETCPLRGSPVRPYVIREVRGVKVGIVGLANDRAVTSSSACSGTRFLDARTAAERAVRELGSEGVRHVVLLTHLGLPADRLLARSVDGIDVIVGGHTHSRLGPDSGEGPYPVVERSPNGHPVLVVTAACAARYLGELHVRFDGDGVPVRWEGAARELTPDDPVDPGCREWTRSLRASLESFRRVVVCENPLEYADGMAQCRKGDCLGAMLAADAMLDFARPFGASVALCNGGNFRAGLPKGVVHRGDLMGVLPFGNSLVLRDVSGDVLLDALEHGVSQAGGTGAWLLHPAGLTYVVDADRPVGRRVRDVRVRNAAGVLVPLDPAGTYRVVMSDYLARGGDGYAMFKAARSVPCPGPRDIDVVERYLRGRSPLTMPEGGRIGRVR